MEWEEIMICKPDLDTCGVGVLAGVSREHQNLIKVVKTRAEKKDLANPKILCIECGGMKGIKYGNFDHHKIEPGSAAGKFRHSATWQYYWLYLPPKDRNPWISRLVAFIDVVDTQSFSSALRMKDIISLSSLFKGMLALYKNEPKEAFLRGIEILQVFLKEDLNPYWPVPEEKILPEWTPYVEEVKRLREASKKLSPKAEWTKIR